MPAQPTITVVDDEDGSATVTVSGSDAGSDNEVFWSRYGGNWEESTAWTSGGTRSGDGDIPVTLGTSGVYLFHVVSTAGGAAVSLPVFRYVSNGSSNPASALLSLIQARVIALQLDGIPDSRVFTHTFLDDCYARALESPCVLIGHVDRPAYLSGTAAPTNRDAVVYPVLVAPVAPANLNQNATVRDRWFNWSYRIKAALTQKGFASGGADFAIVSSALQPGPLVHPEWWRRNAFAAPDVFRFEVWQPRGIV
jgi:hypothetical protein